MNRWFGLWIAVLCVGWFGVGYAVGQIRTKAAIKGWTKANDTAAAVIARCETVAKQRNDALDLVERISKQRDEAIAFAQRFTPFSPSPFPPGEVCPPPYFFTKPTADAP